ncbi:MAG: succinyl-CoA synthetase subunit beta [Anaerolineae bacterium SG8_19]|nr:MAG: succinyl-CoA synthetase subunit beta [Anaerolineae bacterium SG8_19]HCB49635.1 ADP-forming succinate--CoA ligase subunit beta [Chloroflexota bacterium]
MNLHEYQAKWLFAQHGVPIPKGKVATTGSQARSIARELGGRVVVKSQVLTGGRGKAGGVKLANDPDEAESIANQILGLDIKGYTVRKVLVDEAANIRDEIYLAILIDRSRRLPMMMASAAGGMDIEQVAAETPEKIFRIHIDPMIGLRSYQSTYVASGMDLPPKLWREFHIITTGLFDAFRAVDASLAEINPLVVTGENGLLAVDGKLSIDDNALFRHPELAEMRDVDEETESEREARQYGLSYIQLDGNIGCMVNGAGLAMATMDVIKLYGGEPANFLDIGGGATTESVTAALRIILADAKVKAVLFNIFGGIVRGDEVANGIVEALKQIGSDIPMVVRLLGTNAEEGLQILADANMATATTLTEAAQKAVALA